MEIILVPVIMPGVLFMVDWLVPTLVGIAGGVVVSAFFFWLGIRYRSKSGMAYQLHNFIVIGERNVTNLGDIKILFNNVPVPRVVVTQLAVWNTGNTVVKGSDIVDSDPLTICFEEGAAILDAKRVASTQDVNEFRIRISEKDRSRALLEFDYLNASDGAKFQIIHTDAKNKAKLTGSIRGLAKGVENWGDLQEWREQKSRLSESGSKLLAPFILLVPLVILVWVKDLIAARYPIVNRYAEWLGWAFPILIGLFILALFVFVAIYSLRLRSRATPKHLSRN